ncbi:MAG: ribose-phosphate diphosphokinase [archaeon]|nr:ribose-phosphate diphosphokinase [archaeon]
MYIIPTTKAVHVAKTLKEMNQNIIFPTGNRDNKSQFPDGELYARIKEIKELSGERVIILHSGQPNPNSGLIELYSILEILNNPIQSVHIKDKEYEYSPVKKPSSIEVFFLYFPYGMQDKVFETGECNMAESLVKMLTSYYNVGKIYVMDAHFEGARWTKKYPIVTVKSQEIIKEALRQDKIEDAVKIAPDLGSQSRLDISGFSKKRINSFDIELSSKTPLENQVNGKTVVVWDDLIETGGTMVKAAKALRDMGAKKVVAVATHGVLETGIKKITESYSKLYLTNTINTRHANIDISKLVLDAVSK